MLISEAPGTLTGTTPELQLKASTTVPPPGAGLTVKSMTSSHSIRVKEKTCTWSAALISCNQKKEMNHDQDASKERCFAIAPKYSEDHNGTVGETVQPDLAPKKAKQSFTQKEKARADLVTAQAQLLAQSLCSLV